MTDEGSYAFAQAPDNVIRIGCNRICTLTAEEQFVADAVMAMNDKPRQFAKYRTDSGELAYAVADGCVEICFDSLIDVAEFAGLQQPRNIENEIREQMDIVVEHLEGIIAIWKQGGYTSNDFVEKLDLCVCNANGVLCDEPIMW
jgi:hypothetical protein